MSRRILSYWSLIDDTHPHHHNHIMAGWREGHPAFRRTEAESGHCKSHGLENLFFFLLVEALCVMMHYQIFAALHQPNFSLRLTLQWHSSRFKNATNKQTIAATQCNSMQQLPFVKAYPRPQTSLVVPSGALYVREVIRKNLLFAEPITGASTVWGCLKKCPTFVIVIFLSQIVPGNEEQYEFYGL